MHKATLIALSVCTGAIADETISTLDDGWDPAPAWLRIGQTIVVPESNVLESYAFGAEEWAEGDLDYIISVHMWDEDQQHTVGEARWVGFGTLPETPGIAHHDIGLLLAPNSKIAVIIEYWDDDDRYDAGIGWVGNLYEEGSMIATQGSLADPWDLDENASLDLAFTAEFTSCPADFYHDGQLSIFDFLAFQTAFTAGDPTADFNMDGNLDVLDFVAFQGAFLSGCGS